MVRRTSGTLVQVDAKDLGLHAMGDQPPHEIDTQVSRGGNQERTRQVSTQPILAVDEGVPLVPPTTEVSKTLALRLEAVERELVFKEEAFRLS